MLRLVLVACILPFQVVFGGFGNQCADPDFRPHPRLAFAAPGLGLGMGARPRYSSHKTSNNLQIVDSRRFQLGERRCRRAFLKSSLTLRSAAEYEGGESASGVLCQKLTTSFRKVWLQLYTTGLIDDAYLGSLRCFVEDAVEAYDEGFSIAALLLELNVNELETRFDRFDRTERLTEEERKSREVWIFLVYSTLARLKYIPRTGFITETPEDKIGLQPLVEFVAVALEDGFTLEGLHLEMALRQSDEPLTPTQLSLRAQWIRIIFLTNEAMQLRKRSS